MTYSEQAIAIDCAQETLVGILAAPQTADSIGVIVIVGGPQYRAGSHRQFVLLSRVLAAAGHAVLRFDYRGMGDSEGDMRDFEAVTEDIAAAIDTMQRYVPAVQNIVLWGLCDGASAALLYCFDTKDRRVRGLCLLNPWVRSDASLARTHVKHYYMQRLAQREFWAKLLRGGVSVEALSGLIGNVRAALTGSATSAPATMQPTGRLLPFQQRMATAWAGFSGAILLVLSGQDYTAKEFLEYANNDRAWWNALTRPRLTRHDLQSADHTFSDNDSRIAVEDLTREWLEAQVSVEVTAGAR